MNSGPLRVSSCHNGAAEIVQKVEALQSYDEICRAISEELAWFGFTCVTSFKEDGARYSKAIIFTMCAVATTHGVASCSSISHHVIP
jgi:hypothetical protein